MSEIELQLRLDPEGRTAYDPEVIHSTNNDESSVLLDYTSKTCLTLLANEDSVTQSSNNDVLDDLLLDCEITDCALLPRTFWVGATDTKPRCILEQMAMEVFNHHVKSGILYDPNSSGAEWWVQIRPSPPAGRYNLLCSKSQTEKEGDEEEDDHEGICFHWDKDEDLRLMAGGNMYIHPHISTVTYLSNIGAPTMALNYKVSPFSGDYESPSESEPVKAFLSWPKKGKHLSFDGRYLHAAPSNLSKELNSTNKELNVNTASPIEINETIKKKWERRQRRVTFLVNIWLNYKPFNVDPFPESMIDKLSKVRDDLPRVLFPKDSSGNIIETNSVPVVAHCHQGKEIEKDTNTYKTFVWPMGGSGCNEKIEMELNLSDLQSISKNGGNANLQWKCSSENDRGIRLSNTDPEECERKRQKLE